MRSKTLMVRSAAEPRVSNHEAMVYPVMILPRAEGARIMENAHAN